MFKLSSFHCNLKGSGRLSPKNFPNCKSRITKQNELMNINFDLPYITQDLSGIGGKLRKTPQHFAVEELSLYKPIGKGQHLYINLTKENLTTRQVKNQLASLFGVKVRDVGFAGMKDKYARTTQTFSILVGHVEQDFVRKAVKLINEHLSVTAHWAELHKNKLKPGHLLGNRFTITVTDLELPDDEVLCRAEAIANALKEKGLPNFFGLQRFGSDGSNVKSLVNHSCSQKIRQNSVSSLCSEKRGSYDRKNCELLNQQGMA